MDLFNTRLDDSLKRRAQELRHLTSLLRSELPPESDGHFHVANVRDRTVVIMTDSPVWTTRLRQLGPQILTILHNNSRHKLLHIQVFSRPAQSKPIKYEKPVKAKPRQISQQSSELINQTASYIQDDGLRDALKNLAARGSKNKPPNNNPDNN